MNARWDGQSLLQPISADRPCGENLDDTLLLSSFDALRVFGRAAAFDATDKEESQAAGRELVVQTPPNWEELRDRAFEALGKSKDLRLLAYLGAALLRTHGLPAFSATLTTAAGWLKDYWPETYPLLDEDAMRRRNALNCFADRIAIIDGLRRVPLAGDRQHGSFSLRDLDLAAAASDERGGPDEAKITGAFSAMPLEEIRLLQQSAAGGLAALRSIDARMRDEAGPEWAPDFDPLAAQLGRIERVLRGHLASRNGDVAQPGLPGEAAVERVDAGGPAVGAIRSRQDAIRALDAVADFFRKNEPSSPVPLLIDRAKRLVSKDFLEVLADMAPDALAQARAAGGLKYDG